MSIVTYTQILEDLPPRLLSGPMRSASAAGRPLFRVMKVETEAGTVWLSDAGHAGNPVAGPRAVVRSWGSVGRSFSERSDQLQAVELSVEIDDQELWFHKLLAGPYAKTVRQTPVTIYVGAKGVNFSDWYTAFSGVIDGWAQPQAFMWQIRIRPDDTWLKGYMADDPITVADYPQAKDEVIGKRYPILYGSHSSDGFGGGGMVPCLLVNSTTFTYLVCRGYAKAINGVYSAETQVPVADYTVQHTSRNGKTVTEIVFASDQGENEITVDVDGYDSVGDGTGTLIENPADVLRHFIENWCFATYKSGAWLTGAPLDGRSFARAREFFETFSFKDSRRFAEERTKSIEAVNSWASSHNCKLFWTNEGKLAVRVNDHRPIRQYLGPEWWLNMNVDADRGPSMNFDTLAIKDEVTVQYIYDESKGSFKMTLKVRDLELGENASDARDMRWSRSAI